MESNLKITSYNCNGFKSRNYDYVSEIFNTCKILMLQETWLYDFQHINFKKVMPNSQYYAVSAMNEAEVSRVGRPYGGVAILWHTGLTLNGLKLTFIPIVTNSLRLCAVNIKSNSCNIMLINVYMPTDDNSDENFNIYGDILGEISSIIAAHADCEFIIGGDFNVDFSRIHSRNLNLLKDFLEIETLNCATLEIAENNFTRVGSLGEKSFIDHFIVNNNLEYNIDVTPDKGHNLSDHLPVNLQTTYHSEIKMHKNESNYFYDWTNANDFKILNYKQLLDQLFNDFIIPQNVLNCHNYQCVEHNNIILKLSDIFMNILSSCSNHAIGLKKSSHKPGTPGWNSFVKPYREKAIFWHNVWKDAGRPVGDNLADVRRFTRAKYHWAIRKAKYDADSFIKNKTADLLCNKSFKDFWQTIRKLKGSDKTIADVVDGENTDAAISARFRYIYNHLYNSINDENFAQIRANVDDLVNRKCNAGMCSSSHCHTIEKYIVQNAINKLKSNKDDEVYGVSTDHFINATDLVYEKLAQLITVMIRHGLASEIINTSIVKPIPKNKQKSISDSNNYRAISKNTILSKIIDHILLDKVGDKLTTSVYQFAYKEGYSTSMCSFLVAETIQYYKSNGSNVFMLSLDATKAFDLVQYSKLFKLLIDRNICPLLIRFLINIYLSSLAMVKWNGTKSQPFTISNGVKQGAVISAPLFTIYINPLINDLQNSKHGSYIGNICSIAFAYADDIVLLISRCTALRFLTILSDKYAESYKLRFNPDTP